MEIIFWLSLLGTVYAYFLYPGVLYLLGRIFHKPVIMDSQPYTPTVSVIVPVHNESAVITEKLSNLDALQYPRGQLKIIIVADACTDDTIEKIRLYNGSLDIEIYEIEERKGKAHALNTGLKYVDTELVVFSDASILLEPESVIEIVRPFQDPSIGCVSGEDHIDDGGGEGLYGKYELFLRNQESSVGSIVGASGSFYAERRSICKPFEEGLAPDFLSVLNTVEAGYRAITQASARGHMKAVKNSNQEFQRKVRTLLRGMTALFSRGSLLNPIKYGLFSVFLISHKVLRWTVPLFLIITLISNYYLIDNLFYLIVFLLQVIFYSLALVAYPAASPLHESKVARIPLFFVLVNISIGAAWFRYLRGDRQELWSPSKRNEVR